MIELKKVLGRDKCERLYYFVIIKCLELDIWEKSLFSLCFWNGNFEIRLFYYLGL